MKTIIISIFSFLMLGSSLAFAQKSMDDLQVQVDGLGCPFCAYGLEKKFKEFKGCIKTYTLARRFLTDLN